MAGTHSANCLPNEILSIILSYLFKSDLKRIRLVCKLWSEMAIPTLYDRVYVSPHSRDLEVFNSIASEKHLSKFVKELVYDASSFDMDLSKSVYLSRLLSQTEELIAELAEETVFNSPDRHVNSFLKFAQGPYQDLLQPIFTYRFVDQGYSRYCELAEEQEELFDSGQFLVELCQGLRSLPKLHRVTIHDEWQRDDQYQQRALLDPVALRPLRPFYTPLARGWNPLFLEPSPWSPNGLRIPQKDDSHMQCQAMIRALSLSKSCICHLRICPSSRRGISSHFFNTCLGASMSNHSIKVFSGLKRLDLTITSTGESAIGDFGGVTLPDLTKLLASIHRLVNLTLMFIVFPFFHTPEMFDLRDLFGPLGDCSWNLCFLHLSGFAATQSYLHDFLKRQHNVQHLSLADFELLDGDWATMLDKIKALALPLKEFGLLRPLGQREDVDVLSCQTWIDHALETSIPQYVMNNDVGDGLNPLRKLRDVPLGRSPLLGTPC